MAFGEYKSIYGGDTWALTLPTPHPTPTPKALVKEMERQQTYGILLAQPYSTVQEKQYTTQTSNAVAQDTQQS